MFMISDWHTLLLAYLHDPPDKALSIKGHVPRARDNAKIVVGDHISKKALEDAVSEADPLASIIERFPMPTAGEIGERAVGSTNQQLLVFHPLSGASTCLPVVVVRNSGSRVRRPVTMTRLIELIYSSLR